MRCRGFIFFAAVSLGIVFALVFGLSRQPGPAALTVRLLDFTNDSSGQHFARFTVTNRSTLAVKRESHCHMQLRDHPATFPGYHVALPVLLQPGDSEVVLVPVPTNRGPWRVALKAIRVDTGYRLVDTATRTTGSSRLWTRWHNRHIELCWSTGEGEWINEHTGP
jgi:hypothetical protein